MTFIRIIKYTDAYTALPQAKQVEIRNAALAFHDKYFKEGKLKEAYTFGDGSGRIMMVWDVASLEEFYTIHTGSPQSSPYVTTEVIPVLDRQTTRNVIAAATKAAKK